MVSQSSPSSARMASPCSLNSGARPAVAGSLVVLHRCGDQLERVPGRGLAVLQVAVGHGLRVDGRLERVLHHGPLAVEVGEAGAPLVERRRREHLGQRPATASPLLAMSEAWSAKRGSVASSGRPMASHSGGQYLPACRQVNARTRPSFVR